MHTSVCTKKMFFPNFKTLDGGTKWRKIKPHKKDSYGSEIQGNKSKQMYNTDPQQDTIYLFFMLNKV